MPRPARQCPERAARKRTPGRPALALAGALLLAALPRAAQALDTAPATVVYPGAALQRSADGIFSSLIPREKTGNLVIVHGGNIPGRVYGGSDRGQGLVARNTVIVLAGSAARGVSGGFNSPSEAAALPGDREVGGAAEGNTVLVLGGTVSGAVGAGANGTVRNNTVTITAGRITGSVAGALSLGDAAGNAALVAGGSVETEVCGAVSRKGKASGNHLLVTGGALKAACGGRGEAEAAGNDAVLRAGVLEKDIVGGQSALGAARENTVILRGGQVTGRALGGVSDAGGADGNHVLLESAGAGPAICEGGVLAGESLQGAAEANSVELRAGMVFGDVVAGQGADAAGGNSVLIAGGTVDGLVAGGRSHRRARANSVIMRGGLVRDITGGLTAVSSAKAASARAVTATDGDTGSAASDDLVAAMDSRDGASVFSAGNVVRIEGGHVWGSVTGGSSHTGQATGNTVELRAGATLSDLTALRGGVTGSGGDDFTDNTLIVEGALMAGSLENFAVLAFEDPPADGCALTLAGRAILGKEGRETTVLLRPVEESGAGGELPVSFILLRAEGGIDMGAGRLAPGQTGLAWGTRRFDVRLAVEGDALVAHVENVR